MANPKRRAYFVHALQGKLALVNTIYFLGGVLGTWAFVLGPLVLRMNDSGPKDATRLVEAELLLSLHERLVLALVLMVPLIVFHSVRVSHRIGGPLFRFRKIFASIAEGNLMVNTRLRPKDLLQEESCSIEWLIESLRDRVTRMHEACNGIRAASEELSDSVSEEAGSALCKRLTLEIESLEAELSQFNTQSSNPEIQLIASQHNEQLGTSENSKAA